MSMAKVFADIESRITADPERTKEELDGTFKFIITGEDAGSWIVDGKDVGVRQSDDEAEVTITVADEDLEQIHSGALDAMQAFMMGKIEVEGDMGLAMKLQQVL